MIPRQALAQQIGLILQEAALVSPAQIEVALLDQNAYEDLRLGEILALRGWVKQETADFFAERWCVEISIDQRNPLGYYLKSAALLNEQQIQDILKEQPKLGLRFGAIAVLKGWLRQETLSFFLDHLSPQQKEASAFLDCRSPRPMQRISKIANKAHSRHNAQKQEQQLKAKYASASFFDENNLHISEAQIIVPSKQEEKYDLAQALELDLSKFS